MIFAWLLIVVCLMLFTVASWVVVFLATYGKFLLAGAGVIIILMYVGALFLLRLVRRAKFMERFSENRIVGFLLSALRWYCIGSVMLGIGMLALGLFL